MTRALCGVALSAGMAWGGAIAVVRAQDDGTGPSPSETPLVLSAEVDSIIHPVSAEFMIETMARADEEEAALLVFTLRTPGGLVDSTEAIVTKMIATRTPVAVYVAPSGARAASAGFILVIAADVAVMSPGTHIGAAHPVSGSGEQMDEVMAKKAASDVAARVRALATARGRNVSFAEQAVTDSRAFTDTEALEAEPPLIDLRAADLDELLDALDGRQVSRFDGATMVLRTAGARVVTVDMTWRQRVLSAVANPNIAYILLSLGTLGLTIELWNPGAVLPGVVGGLCLLLAFFALQILPVNYVGLLLMGFALLLFILEIKITSFGLLSVGGVISLLFGSLMLIDSPVPALQISWRVILPVTLSLAGIMIFLARLAVAAQMTRPVTGNAGLLGAVGEALSPIGPQREGQIRTHGEIWRAAAPEPIVPGDRVKVTAVQGLTLTVRLDKE